MVAAAGAACRSWCFLNRHECSGAGKFGDASEPHLPTAKREGSHQGLGHQVDGRWRGNRRHNADAPGLVLRGQRSPL